MTIEQLNKFEKYLNREMDLEELETFNAEMENSDELKRKFFSFKAALSELAAEKMDKKDPKPVSESTETPIIPITQSKKYFGYKTLAFAASIAILFSCFWYFSILPQSKNLLTALNPVELSLPKIHAKSSPNNSIDANWKAQLTTEIEQENWKNAINLIQPKLAQSSTDDVVNILHLHLGYAQFKSGDYDLAIENFDLMASKVSPQKLYKGPKQLGLYYRSLALLGQGKKEEAITILNQLNQPEISRKIKEAADDLLTQTQQ